MISCTKKVDFGFSIMMTSEDKDLRGDRGRKKYEVEGIERGEVGG